MSDRRKAKFACSFWWSGALFNLDEEGNNWISDQSVTPPAPMAKRSNLWNVLLCSRWTSCMLSLALRDDHPRNLRVFQKQPGGVRWETQSLPGAKPGYDRSDGMAGQKISLIKTSTWISLWDTGWKGFESFALEKKCFLQVLKILFYESEKQLNGFRNDFFIWQRLKHDIYNKVNTQKTSDPPANTEAAVSGWVTTNRGGPSTPSNPTSHISHGLSTHIMLALLSQSEK